jgi:hypothetical protein
MESMTSPTSKSSIGTIPVQRNRHARSRVTNGTSAHPSLFGQAHLRRILGKYASYYNESRIHRSLDKDAPSGD